MRASWAAPVLLALVLAGCTGGDEPPDLAEPAPPAFDCEAVARAASDLDAAGTAELERLGIPATDPRSLTVTLVAAGKGAPAYWDAVGAAVTDDAPGAVRDDVEAVRTWWAGLAPDLDAVSLGDGSAEAVTAAGDALAAVSDDAQDPAVGPAQQRAEDALSASCG